VAGSSRPYPPDYDSATNTWGGDFEHFQGIYGGEEHIDWVRRILRDQQTKPVADVTREELIEVVSRAMPQNGGTDAEAYMAIFDKNVPRSGASNLIIELRKLVVPFARAGAVNPGR
jgi:hypothetical protein